MLTFEMKNGLRESTAADIAMMNELRDVSVPFSLLWEDRDDSAKIFNWDKAWEDHLEHRAKLIDSEGREGYLPWNAYRNLGIRWIDGYAYSQKSGDCVSFGHRNSLKASNLTNALRTGRKPKEIAQSVAYAMARGSYRNPVFGSGANLIPMAKIAAEYGNYWAEDFGAYDTGRYVSKFKAGSEQDIHAKKTQSIICFLPKPTFDYVFKATSAGYGVCIGTSIFPGGSRVNSDGLAQVSNWDAGAHCTSIIAAWVGKSGKRYVYLENSHPTAYATDDLNSGHQWGCWLTEEDLRRMTGGNSFDYGDWYVNIGELGS